MTETVNLMGDEIPAYIQALLNIIAFFVAAAAMWYAYFVKGRHKAGLGDQENGLTNYKLIYKMNDNLFRIANSLEQIHDIVKHDSDEAEIQRRVKERLGTRKGT